MTAAPLFAPGDKVVKMAGSRPGVVVREGKPDRAGRRVYVVRDAAAGTCGRVREIDMRHDTLCPSPRPCCEWARH